VRVLRAAAAKTGTSMRRGGKHTWLDGLPFKMRFRHSRIYASLIPFVVIGAVVGLLTAVMGVGGGFMLVPAMIYLMRIPTRIVIGTSTVQILFVTASRRCCRRR
jgi:uncharacterized membrane protein YfcA